MLTIIICIISGRNCRGVHLRSTGLITRHNGATIGDVSTSVGQIVHDTLLLRRDTRALPARRTVLRTDATGTFSGHSCDLLNDNNV